MVALDRIDRILEVLGKDIPNHLTWVDQIDKDRRENGRH